MTVPRIARAGQEQRERVVEALADAFAADPLMNWVMPRADLYPQFFRFILRRVYLPRGLVHLEQADRGAALWLPPGEHVGELNGLPILTLVARTVLSHGFGFLANLRALGPVLDRFHPREPHFYLQFVGARSASQGLGVGSALLKTGIRLADEAALPAYLESSAARNVPLYERHGFEVMEEVSLPHGGPTIWPMYRPARG